MPWKTRLAGAVGRSVKGRQLLQRLSDFQKEQELMSADTTAGNHIRQFGRRETKKGPPLSYTDYTEDVKKRVSE